MYFTGFADEASPSLDRQIQATKELGWSNIEARSLFGKNLGTISDAEFELLQQKLSEAGVSINCYGSAVANWANPITESPEKSYAELRTALPRMRKLGTGMIRIMSFAVPQELKARAWEFEEEVVKRLQVIVRMAEDAGVVCVHENCMNWGGLSYEHTLRLCDRLASSPSFRLVFDTGNPVFNDDYSKTPLKKQSSWEFYSKVRDFVVYIHIKDGKFLEDGTMKYTFGGEGDGDVRRILTDAFSRGYDGGISIEPHMNKVFHDPDASVNERLSYENYVEYGKRMMALVDDIRKTL